jgi:hypothetical protein
MNFFKWELRSDGVAFKERKGHLRRKDFSVNETFQILMS